MGLRAGERRLSPDVDALDGVADGRPLGVVSNNYDPAVEFVVDHHGPDAFSFVRGRDPGVDGFRRRKPGPHYLCDTDYCNCSPVDRRDGRAIHRY
jgi:hypothetical protein